MASSAQQGHVRIVWVDDDGDSGGCQTCPHRSHPIRYSLPIAYPTLPPTSPQDALLRDAARQAGRPARLVLVRHAESARNVAKRGSRHFVDDDARKPVQGIADHHTRLTPRGHEQARLTGIALRREYGLFDYAYHSGYARTRATLNVLLSAWSPHERRPIKRRHHLFLRERDTGYTFDMTVAETAAAFPWLQPYWDTYGPIFARPPGGESLADVAQRVYLFVNMLFRDRAGQRILIVSHGGTMWMFRMLLERWTSKGAEKRMRTGVIANCSTIDYAFDPDAGRLVLRSHQRVWWQEAE